MHPQELKSWTNKILQDANSVSNNLGGLVSVAIAQVYGSMQLTIGTDTHGNLNNSDIMMFMKNIGGFGAKSVNTSCFSTMLGLSLTFKAELLPLRLCMLPSLR